jgi:hypothetical protein
VVDIYWLSATFTASIIRAMIVLVMEAISTSETSENLYRSTDRNITEITLFRYKILSGVQTRQ